MYNDYLYHHGVKGMKWGVRHTPERSLRGNVHRGLSKVYGLNERYYKRVGNDRMANANASARNSQLKKAEYYDKKMQSMTPEQRAKQRKDTIKKATVIGGSVVAAGLAVYGGYKLSQHNAYKNSKQIDELFRNNWGFKSQEITEYRDGTVSNITRFGWDSKDSENKFNKLMSKQHRNPYYRHTVNKARLRGDSTLYY